MFLSLVDIVVYLFTNPLTSFSYSVPFASSKTSGCSGAKAIKVIPNIVSGLVVKTSKTDVESSIGNLIVAPIDFPIQFFCIVITASGHFPSSSFKSSSKTSA